MMILSRRLPRAALSVATATLATLSLLSAGTVTAVAAPSPAPVTSRVPHTQRHLTAAAKRAGLEPGNARMGWRNAETTAVRPTRRALSKSKSKAKAYTPPGILGMDVASYQGNLSFAKWAKKGRAFAYVKATEGTSYRNPYFPSQYANAATAGMMHGAYHFASPNGKSGTKQAAYFVKYGGGWVEDGQTLPGVLDIEYNPYGSTCYGLSKKKMIKWIGDFTVAYKRLTTRDAVIYTTTDWWTRCTGNTSAFSKTNPIWAARYGTKTVGTLPAKWTTATFWQYTSTPLDQDVFSATADRLTVLANGHEDTAPKG